MSKSQKKTIIKKIKNTAKRTLPIINKGLTKIGSTAKKVATETIPVIDKGVSAVYETMSTGLDLGVKTLSKISKKTHRNRSNSTRYRYRRHHSHHRH